MSLFGKKKKENQDYGQSQKNNGAAIKPCCQGEKVPATVKNNSEVESTLSSGVSRSAEAPSNIKSNNSCCSKEPSYSEMKDRHMPIEKSDRSLCKHNTANSQDIQLSVKVLGSGCAKCNALEAEAKAALSELAMDAEIDHVTDFAQIAAYGVMITPALVINNKVVSSGRVLKMKKIIEIIKKQEA